MPSPAASTSSAVPNRSALPRRKAGSVIWHCSTWPSTVNFVAAMSWRWQSTPDRASVRQKKTGRPLRFKLTGSTRQAIDDYLRATGKKPDEYLFTGRRGPNCSLTTHQYARLLSDWLTSVGLDPHRFGTQFTTSNTGAPHLPMEQRDADRLAWYFVRPILEI